MKKSFIAKIAIPKPFKKVLVCQGAEALGADSDFSTQGIEVRSQTGYKENTRAI
jgi:hypothetical protein